MKLNLGCGRRILPGYINIDLTTDHGADMAMDIRVLTPFDNDTVDEILSVHVCEHFYRHDLVSVLKEWRDILKPGGKLIVELPCLDKVLRHFMRGSPENMTLWPLFGDPSTHKDGEPALHKWCYSVAEFKHRLGEAGFTEIEEQTPHYHQPSRDMRFVCTK